MPKNAFYAQSGGVTAVINATAAGVFATCRQNSDKIGAVFAGQNGILGALEEALIDTATLSSADLEALAETPGGAFGSCRYKLKSLTENRAEYERLLHVFKAHDIGYFFYNGGGDSQDTAHKISQLSQETGYPLISIGIPKTVDNDLPFTDNCPGFGSAAKYIAVSTLECSLDVASMAVSSTKVFVLEVMGRHAGWLAAASALAQPLTRGAPHLILFPERPFVQSAFLETIQKTVHAHGYCVIVASEGIRYPNGQFVAESGSKDAFGHAQLGGVAPTLAHLIRQELHLKNHWAVADYLQRAARHLASQVDVDQAYALGQSAVTLALAGKNAVMPIIVRDSHAPYRWHIEDIPLERVANVEKKLPPSFIDETGFGITEACREYLTPLIQGEAYPPYQEGLPRYLTRNYRTVPRKLSESA